MNTAFSLDEGKWKLTWPGRVAQHDIVCLSPPLDPTQGLPLGNGDIGVLVWCEPRKLCLQVNKCDLWDDEPAPENGFFGPRAPWYTEDMTSLRHACRLEFDFNLPVMDSWYLEDFEARLDLAQGLVAIRSKTPFGRFSARIFVEATGECLVLEYELETDEPSAPVIHMERWGSRIGQSWYSQLERDPRYGLGGTACQADKNTLVISQSLRTLNFAVGASVVDQGACVLPAVANTRGGSFRMIPATRHTGGFYLTVANSEEKADPGAEVRRVLADVRKTNPTVLLERHSAWWRAFWQDSFVTFDDPFLEQIWHLALYYAGSSQRGRYPGLFTQGLWGWNRDFQPWTFYFHWNQQQLIWPLCAMGHPELMKAYLDFRHAQLPGAVAAAKRQGKPGAHYCDVSDRRGNMAINLNRTPGGQIAADFWRYYCYSGDLEYLREKGWPVIRETAAWHYALLERHADGLYHATPAWGYEGGNILRDCASELITARRVFEIAIETARLLDISMPELLRWQDALDHLAPLVMMKSPVTGNEIFAAGYQKGIEKDAGKISCGAFKSGDEEEWADPQPTCAHDPKRWGQIFSDVETSPVFPDGRIGLGQRGSKDFELALNTARESDMHWTKKIVYARLGMKEDLARELAEVGDKWTCTGFSVDDKGFWGTAPVADPRKNPVTWNTSDFKTSPDWDDFKKSRVPMRMWEFRRIGQERTYLITAALTEMLLQSHDGVIRIAPAFPWNRPFAFTLLATGGFVVSAEGIGGQTAWVHIASQRGGVCRIANPWDNRAMYWRNLRTDDWQKAEGNEAVFATEPGERYLVAPAPIPSGEWVCATRPAAPASGPRQSANGTVTLGIPRMF